MKINDEHWLDNAEIVKTPNHGGEITPRFIVMHYTASDSGDGAVAHLTNPMSCVSAHLVVDLDGRIWQLAPFNIKTWHAGPSRHMGYSGLNNHSIGIEFVNFGWVRNVNGRYERDHVRYVAPFGTELLLREHSRVGSDTYFWPTYPERQLVAGANIVKALIARYNIIDIVSHEEIDTRGWKTDPGPAFPMADFTRLLNDRKSDADEYEVTASTLNVRSGPGMFEIIDKLRLGDIVAPLDTYGDWARISEDGWVHSAYLRRA